MKPLWNHQIRCIERNENVTNFALFMEMGVGKSRTCIEILKQKFAQEGRNLRTLILCPTVVTYNWKSELSKFWPELNQSHVLVLSGSGDERRRLLDRTPNYFVVIANYESLLMDPVYIALKNWGPECIVGDESHRFKSLKAQRTKRLIGLSVSAKYKYILSGTPVTNNESDLFAQYLFLDNGQTFGKSYFNFRNTWFTDVNAKIRQFSPAVKWPNWQPKKHKADEFREKVMSKAMSVTKAECLDLPPYTQVTIEVGMSREQAKAYKDMKEEYITFVKSKAFTAELAITKALRCLQITAGFLMNAEGEIHSFDNTPKQKALLELIEEASGKVVVWTCWRANQKALHELFKKEKIEHRMLTGDQSAEQKAESLADFQDKPEVKVMLASQGAGGIGISLVSANVAIYYGRNFSYEQDAQSSARIHRGGQTATSVTRYDLVIKDTVDESCMQALTKKEDLANSIINGHLIL